MRLRLRVAAMLLFCCTPLYAQTDHPLPVESFSQLPQYENVRLSPDGNKLAYVVNHDKAKLAILTVYDRVKRKQEFLAQTNNKESTLNWFNWANNEVLLASIAYASKRGITDTVETRLLKIDLNKPDELKPLIKPRNMGSIQQAEHYSQFQDTIIDWLPDDPEHILMALDLDVATLPSVYKINIDTGSRKRVKRGKRKIRRWVTDQQSRVRLGVSLDYKTGERNIYVLNLETEDWETIFSYNALTDKPIWPLGFDLNPNQLYYSAYKGDKLAIYSMDLTSKQSELVFEDPEYDADGRLIYSTKTRDVIGITHGNTKTGKIYWDNNRARLQRGLDKSLPDTHNYLIDFSNDEIRYILYTENDAMPGTYFIGNREKGTLDYLFSAYPQLDKKLDHDHRLVSYQARDGMTIEGYLTLPAGASGPLPTILHPHGGPGARDVSGFDYWTSFLISRGYAVFRPNFRGSTGYGYEFAQSQMQGWGLQMQDDITDAANWLVERGTADPERMCIVGASYGGYAAAMAAVKTPDLFKCAISFAGVMDLKQLVRKSRRYTNKKFVENQIGDDSDDLKARSPYYNAEKIKIPMLLLHGEDDRVVDVVQSREFSEELEDLGKPFEYIELPQGDHYLSVQENRHTAFAAMAKFLSKHLDNATTIAKTQ